MAIHSSMSFHSSEGDQDELVNYHMELKEKSKFEAIRRKLTIDPSSNFYQVWKVFGVLLSFYSSFTYASAGAMLHLYHHTQRESFHNQDNFLIAFFFVDMCLHIILDEHKASEGKWTLRKSIHKQLKGKLLLDILAIFPFGKAFSGMASERMCQQMYVIKSVRMIHGASLLDFNQYKRQLKQL
jgi:hypothetical protein